MTQAETLAREILLLSRNTLLVNLRFLDAALSQFVLTPASLPFATDGQNLYYDPRHVLLCYKEEKEASVRNYLHLVFHCVFRHMYVHTLVDQALWDLSCDIAVEEVINGLLLPSTAAKRQEPQQTELARLRQTVKPLTAEKLYRHFQDHPPRDPENLRALFLGDDHTPWYLPQRPQLRLAETAGKTKTALPARETAVSPPPWSRPGRTSPRECRWIWKPSPSNRATGPGR